MASQLLPGALNNDLTSTLVLARNLVPDPHRRETGVAVEAARWVAALTGAVLPQAVEDGDKVLDSLHEWLRDGVILCRLAHRLGAMQSTPRVESNSSSCSSSSGGSSSRPRTAASVAV